MWITFINFIGIKFKIETNWIIYIFIFLTLINWNSTKCGIHRWFCIHWCEIEINLDWIRKRHFRCWTWISDWYSPSHIDS
jgi:hypothetical protein